MNVKQTLPQELYFFYPLISTRIIRQISNIISSSALRKLFINKPHRTPFMQPHEKPTKTMIS